MADIWTNLKDAIQSQVESDGFKEEFLLPTETKDEAIQDAVDNIYGDVAEFYYWYYNPSGEDDRHNWLKGVPNKLPKALVDAVKPIVVSNLAAMKDAGEIPDGIEPNIDDVTNNLVGYIVNWQDWFYERKVLEEWDNYDEQGADWIDIYNSSEDDDYGDDIYAGGIYDGDDVPFADYGQ